MTRPFSVSTPLRTATRSALRPFAIEAEPGVWRVVLRGMLATVTGVLPLLGIWALLGTCNASVAAAGYFVDETNPSKIRRACLHSTDIVRARVIALESRPSTRWSFRVDTDVRAVVLASLKGEHAAADTVTFVQSGGRLDGRHAGIIAGIDQPCIGRTYLLFLVRCGDGETVQVDPRMLSEVSPTDTVTAHWLSGPAPFAHATATIQGHLEQASPEWQRQSADLIVQGTITSTADLAPGAMHDLSVGCIELRVDRVLGATRFDPPRPGSAIRVCLPDVNVSSYGPLPVLDQSDDVLVCLTGNREFGFRFLPSQYAVRAIDGGDAVVRSRPSCCPGGPRLKSRGGDFRRSSGR
ncbi:MAG: hypothetical protein IPK72_12190 [Candidatus Eisenbacteria bacterium]|nr:hypothetical protein [Candidatus Eisenbacteria bacterium]